MHVWPTFTEQYLDAKEPGALFHAFIAELFRRRLPSLISYGAFGKDGAIDLYDPETCSVIECKFIGEVGSQAIKARWRQVQRNLFRNLQPTEPEIGQSQYAPWYETQKPIRRYVLCASSTIQGDQHRREIESLVRSDFLTLAKRSGLEHLAEISVELWTWDRIAPELAQYPALRLSWFGQQVPTALTPLRVADENRHIAGTFKHYLSTTGLSYVRLSAANLTPAAVLQELTCSPASCLIVHGPGGIGKTRLALEVAREGMRQGMMAYEALSSHLDAEAVGQLARLSAGADCVILVDYLEEVADFDSVNYAVRIANLEGASIRLLATCRSTYWQMAQSEMHLDVKEVELLTQDAQAVVLSILGEEHSDLLEVCKGLPVLSAFVRYLADKGKKADLLELRQERDFGVWWLRHILGQVNAAGHQPPATPRALGRLLSMLPCDTRGINIHTSGHPEISHVIEILEADGWLERTISNDATNESWRCAHDLIADGALLRALDIPLTRRSVLIDFLDEAIRCKSTYAFIRTLQRNAGATQLDRLDWVSIFAARRFDLGNLLPLIFSSRLLDREGILSLMKACDDSRTALCRNHRVQTALGHVVHGFAIGEAPAPSQQDIDLVTTWLDAALDSLVSSNLPLTQALKWKPSRYRQAALSWLTARATELQSNYLLAAWLGATSETQPVETYIELWLQKFHDQIEASYVYGAWLEAQGSVALVLEPMRKWLDRYGGREEASHVYKSWLKVTREAPTSDSKLHEWLELHMLSPSASYVYSALLETRNVDLNYLRPFIQSWLSSPQDSEAVSFVLTRWLRANGDFHSVQSALQQWLAEAQNARTDSAGYIYSAVGRVIDEFPDWLEAAFLSRIEVVELNEDSRFFLSYLTRLRTPLSDTAQLKVLNWCLQHQTLTEAVITCSAISMHVSPRNLPDCQRAIVTLTNPQTTSVLGGGGIRATLIAFVALTRAHHVRVQAETNQLLTDLGTHLCRFLASLTDRQFVRLATSGALWGLSGSALPLLLRIGLSATTDQATEVRSAIGRLRDVLSVQPGIHDDDIARLDQLARGQAIKVCTFGAEPG
jgi:hypothetical protein